MTRYLLITDFQPGVAEPPMEDWKPEEVEAHLNYYRLLHREPDRERRALDQSPHRARPGQGRDIGRRPRR